MRLNEITASPLPFKSFKELFHVGSMNATDKDKGSFEGAGLSVSLHPNQWREIAKLPGSIWRCTKQNNKFVDYHKLTKRHRAVIEEWAIRNGIAEPKTAWKVSFYDDETDETRYFTFYNKTEAEKEAEYFDTEIEEIPGGTMCSTPRFSQRMMQHIHGVECFDLIVVAYAEDVLNCDGVWWQDNLNVSALSAPRGVIVPSMISTWGISELEGKQKR